MFTNQNALIFAAYGEISAAVARRLAQLGANVHLSGRNLDRVTELAKEIRSGGGTATSTRVDACNEDEVEAFIADVSSRGTIDFAFNGIGPRAAEAEYATPSPSLPYRKFVMALETIAGSQFLTARAAAPYMLRQKSGVIVLLSATLMSAPVPLMAGVTAACGAVEAMTMVLAAECGGAGVRVNCFARTASAPPERSARPASGCVWR